MPERQQSPTAAEAEAALHKHYKRLYVQLSMQAQHELFSGKTLSGRGAAPCRVGCMSCTEWLRCNPRLPFYHADRCLGAETLYEQSVSVNGASITVTAEDPLLRFVRTQRLPANLAP